jgi:hypothetical protein
VGGKTPGIGSEANGNEDLVHTDSLIRSFGFSIAAVEIAQRGVIRESVCTRSSLPFASEVLLNIELIWFAVSVLLSHTDSLIRSFGFSIAAVEIAQRGVQSEPGSTLLDMSRPSLIERADG